MTAALLESTVRPDDPASMTAEERLPEACEGMPQRHWGLGRLGRRLELEDERIRDKEIEVTPHYWYLGRILALARPSLAHGQVTPWQEAHGIKPNHAYRGRLLAAFFASPRDLDGLTLNEALKLAEDARDHTPLEAKRKVRRHLAALNKTIGAIRDEIGALRDRSGLLDLLEAPERNLASMRRVCCAPTTDPPSAEQLTTNN